MIRIYVLCVPFIVASVLSFSPVSTKLDRPKEVHLGTRGRLHLLTIGGDAEDMLVMSGQQSLR
jgi:hypothetical protein